MTNFAVILDKSTKKGEIPEVYRYWDQAVKQFPPKRTMDQVVETTTVSSFGEFRNASSESGSRPALVAIFGDAIAAVRFKQALENSLKEDRSIGKPRTAMIALEPAGK